MIIKGSLAAETPDKYEYDSKDLTYNFAKWKVFLTGKFRNGYLVTPNHGSLSICVSMLIDKCFHTVDNDHSIQKWQS